MKRTLILLAVLLTFAATQTSGYPVLGNTSITIQNNGEARHLGPFQNGVSYPYVHEVVTIDASGRLLIPYMIVAGDTINFKASYQSISMLTGSAKFLVHSESFVMASDSLEIKAPGLGGHSGLEDKCFVDSTRARSTNGSTSTAFWVAY